MINYFKKDSYYKIKDYHYFMCHKYYSKEIYFSYWKIGMYYLMYWKILVLEIYKLFKIYNN